MKANQTDHLPDSVAWSLAVVSPVVTPRAADFIALQSAMAECTPQGRHRAQDIRRRQRVVVAAARPQPDAQHYAI